MLRNTPALGRGCLVYMYRLADYNFVQRRRHRIRQVMYATSAKQGRFFCPLSQFYVNVSTGIHFRSLHSPRVGLVPRNGRVYLLLPTFGVAILRPRLHRLLVNFTPDIPDSSSSYLKEKLTRLRCFQLPTPILAHTPPDLPLQPCAPPAGTATPTTSPSNPSPNPRSSPPKTPLFALPRLQSVAPICTSTTA